LGGSRLISGSRTKMMGARPAMPSGVCACTPRKSKSGSNSVLRITGELDPVPDT
jgi:hypothetical protein